jgi:hypothetical protein
LHSWQEDKLTEWTRDSVTGSWNVKGLSRGLLLEICRFRKLILKLIILKLPGHLPVYKPSVVPYCLENCQDIAFASLSEYQPPAGSSTLFYGQAPGDSFPEWTAHLRAVPLAALNGEAHDAGIRHGRITSNSVWVYRSVLLQL